MNDGSLPDALWAILALLALLAGWLALRQAARTRHSTGLPPGRVVYADTGHWRPTDAPFFSAVYGLTGKPDYVVETRAGLIPVEVKSGVAPPQPYASHTLQLAAYCLLVEENEGQAPPHGLIKYANAIFEVAYTPTLRDQVIATLEAMRRWRSQGAGQDSSGGAPRSHAEPQRCAGCGYRQLCDQSLA